jgi:hypothetical protein
MSKKLWIEYKEDKKTSRSKISTEGCRDVEDFIRKIRKEPQFSFMKDSEIILVRPSGTAVDAGESISSLLPRNSSKSPLRVQISAPLPTPTGPNTGPISIPFWGSWPSISIGNGISYFLRMPRLFRRYIVSLLAIDAELTSFWNSLRQMSADKDLLHLPLMKKLMEESNKTLYIRKAYEDLFNIILNNLNPEKPNSRVHRMAIMGIPGVGKSTFLFYVMWRVAHMETAKTMILHRHMDNGNIYVFQNHRCWKTRNLDYVDEFLEDPSTWYLVDTLEPPPGQVNAVTILVAPPARRHYETFTKYLGTPPLYYFPVWSLEELKLVAPSYSRDLKEIEERYYKIGGIPRYVLGKKDDLKTVIRSAVGRLAIEKFPLIASGSVSKEDQVSHLIVQFVVDTSSYLDFTLQMASSYATEMAMEVFLQNQEEEMKRFILDNSPIPALATLRGSMFKAYAHQKLAKGGKFIGRSLENEEECELNFPAMDISRFFNVFECKDPKLYYVPWYSNHPCIDSVVLNRGYFQMTIAWEHDIVWSRLKEMVDVLKMDKLYFVVPHTIFGKFQRQKFVRNMGNQERADKEKRSISKRSFNEEDGLNKKKQRTRRGNNDGNSQRDLVHQYVIPISLEPNMEAWLSKIVSKEQVAQQNERNEGITK